MTAQSYLSHWPLPNLPLLPLTTWLRKGQDKDKRKSLGQDKEKGEKSKQPIFQSWFGLEYFGGTLFGSRLNSLLATP